ncbi:MAG: SDR family oxidoreductase [Candidatus Methylomirabilis oxyfera]|nr:SDR family oxidoreductase [Candidatus Methylomirabilis oxyfera]
MANVLIAGCGYVGTAFGAGLASEGHVVWGLRRRPDALLPGIRPLAADLTVPRTLQALPRGLDFVFYTASADASDDDSYRAAYVDGLRNLLHALGHQRQDLRRVFFTSSTGVYAQSTGTWVDETSPTEPAEFSGFRVLEGERLLLGSSFPSTVLRLGGIYGPGRTRLIERVRRGLATCPDGPPLYTNRIHRDDCAGALRHLMTLAEPASLYLGVDHEPAEQCEVLRWLARQLGVSPPRLEPPLGSTPRHQSNKRCSNAKLVASGYAFRYPGFRDGYLALLAEGVA